MRRVGAIISVGQGYLCQLRDDRPDIEWPSHWALFGGHVDEGETDMEAIRRELREELGWVPSHLMKVCERDGIAYFHCRNDDLSLLSQREGQAMGVFSPRHLPKPMIPYVKQLLSEYAS